MLQEILKNTPELESLISEIFADYQAYTLHSTAQLESEIVSDQNNGKLEKQLSRSATTSAVLARHRERVETWVEDRRDVIVLTHSQGNLFANAAYKHARSIQESIGIDYDNYAYRTRLYSNSGFASCQS